MIDRLLERSTGLEVRQSACGQVYRFTRARISARPFGAVLDAELTESDKIDFAANCKLVADCVKCRIDNAVNIVDVDFWKFAGNDAD